MHIPTYYAFRSDLYNIVGEQFIIWLNSVQIHACYAFKTDLYNTVGEHLIIMIKFNTHSCVLRI